LTSASRVRIRQLAEEGDPRALRVERLLKDPASYLTTILVLNSVAIITASSVATVLALKIVSSRWGDIIETVLLSLIVLIFVEITPKTIAIQNAERASLVFAGLILAIQRALAPILWLLGAITDGLVRALGGNKRGKNPFVTEEELRMLVNVGEEEGILEPVEKEMIHGVFEFGDTIVREVMKPRIAVVAIDEDAPFTEVLETATKAGYSRIPVYKTNLDNVIGLLYVRDLLPLARTEPSLVSLAEIIRPPLFVHETMKVDDLFRDMQRKKIHMAIVIDEYGGTAGIVTIEDLLEEIVGDIQDEYDKEEPEVERQDDNTFLLDARLSIDRLGALFDTELEVEDVDTVGGLIASMLGRIPSQGDEVSLSEGIVLQVLSLEGHAIRRVRASRKSTAEPDAAPKADLDVEHPPT
jgi:CBS domain containing-hemolysin-like protein